MTAVLWIFSVHKGLSFGGVVGNGIDIDTGIGIGIGIGTDIGVGKGGFYW